MNFHKIAVLTLSLLAITTTQITKAQTCRIKTSVMENGQAVYTEVFEYDFVDEKPEFPGGSSGMINFINSTRKYPCKAYEQGIQGRVTCAFVVNPDGKISNVKVIRGVETSLNQEAIRVISEMPPWSPGKLGNETVPVRVICCIPFRK